MLRAKMLMLLLMLLSCSWLSSVEASVSYDHKAIIINGQRRILIAGDIHYPRSTPQMWPDLIQKAKDGGVEVIQTYVFWSGHEPSPGKYNFEDRYNLVGFIKLIHKMGLYVSLRIGPYVCSEWNFGGLPVWLKFVPGVEFRTNNEPFKAAMQNFTVKIVNMMKAEKLYEPQGGPIILSQVENEYELVEWGIGKPGREYSKWAANMAVGLNTGVPWIMCKQASAPDPVINTCNGYYCDGFTPNKPYKPKMWTEAWSAWLTEFGGAVPTRTAEDLAYAVAKFIQKGGSFISYYMYYGGTNFGRSAGGPLVASSYDWDAPIDEYGLLREPKWGHLRDLHKAIKLCEPALVSADPSISYIGRKQEAHVFKSETGNCAAFLANHDYKYSAKVTFGNRQYELPPWSISILPDCKTPVFNTARLGTQITLKKMTPVSNLYTWQSHNEERVSSGDVNTITKDGLWEQKFMTKDASDYLWYMTEVKIDSNEGFLKNAQDPLLTVMSAGHALQVFINGVLQATAYGTMDDPRVTLSKNVKMKPGVNKLSLLSITVGLPNIGLHFDTWNYGVLGPVTLKGLNEGTRDLSKHKWSYKVGLKGEALNLYTDKGSNLVQWENGSMLARNWPLTWYKTTFDAPELNDPVAFDMSSMGKGMVWINGQSIGRHWPGYIAGGKYTCGTCNYAGLHDDYKCRTRCGRSSQRLYHVPRSWIKPTGNLLVVFEEWGGDPSGISLVKITTDLICAEIVEGQPTLTNWTMQSSGKVIKPEAQLFCPSGKKITSVRFASYGNPWGKCGNFQQGNCHAKNYDALTKNCVGKQKCSVPVSPEVFGGDPCPNISAKKLAVEAVCG